MKSDFAKTRPIRAQALPAASLLMRNAICACGGGCPRCVNHPPIQPKLAVSEPGDQYEQDADQVADQVMRMPAPTLQRSAIGCAIDSDSCPGRSTDELLQRKPAGTASISVTDTFVQDPGPGQPLSAVARAFFEPRFGHDFSEVRVHTDQNAAESSRQVSAQAYTVGRDIVFGAAKYQPDSVAGGQLLAHELTHVLQQSGTRTLSTAIDSQRAAPGPTGPHDISSVDRGGPQLQRQATDPALSGPCDQPHTDQLIAPAFTEARRWRRLTAAWLEAHLDHIRARGSLSRDGFVRVGRTVFNELRLLERHFRISSGLRISLPYSDEDLVSIADLERLGNASYWVRRRFGEVELTLSFLCQTNCPRGRTGSDTLGSAVPGSHEVTFYTNCFDRQHETTRAGVALHEAFHASFSEFNHDTYSFEGSYPGYDGLTNAESFSTFAAIIATGSNYRIIVLPEITIHGGS